MRYKQLLKDYFSFTRKERIAVLTVLFLILVVLLLPRYIKNADNAQGAVGDTSWIAKIRNLEVTDAPVNERNESKSAGDRTGYDYKQNHSGADSKAPTLFYFDPNTIDETGWQRLGLKDRTIHTIQNYLVKGGHFRKAEDLKRIYGLRPEEFARLEPYVKIGNDPGETVAKPAEYPRKENKTNKTPTTSIDINTADTTAFKSLPGIGTKLAARIISFRERLGGFYSIEQVAETYGLADSTFQKIKTQLFVGDALVKKININTANIDELKSHPYLRFKTGNAIISYRNEHGNFSKLEDIKKVMAVTDSVYKKLAPYLATQ